MGYNIIKEKFLEAKLKNGKTELLTLLDVIQRAHEVKDINIDSYCFLDKYAMYKFLITLAEDVFRPAGVDDIVDICKAGTFNEGEVSRYFNENANKFDLFSPDYPLLQERKEFFNNAKKAITRIGYLSPVVRSGNNDVFYNPIGGDDRYAVTPTQALCLLLRNAMSHSVTGGASKTPLIGGVGDSCVYCLYKGTTLFETIVLNMTPVAETDIPMWRRNDYGIVYPFSLMNYEFYPTPKILLNMPEKDGLIHSCLLQIDKGHPIYKEKNLKALNEVMCSDHPNLLVVASKKDGKFPLVTSKAGEPWMQLSTVLANRIDDTDIKTNRNYVIDALDAEGLCPQAISIEMYGVNIRHSPFLNIFYGTPELPVEIFTDSRIAHTTREYLEYIRLVSATLNEIAQDYTTTILSNSPNAKMSGEYRELKGGLLRFAQMYFFTEYVKHYKERDESEFKDAIKDVALKLFSETTPIHGNAIQHITYKNKLRRALEKIQKKQEEKG
ncbi:MAG: type I-E CRISPR-associated protein Cse1/CasA [Lachnospiraceae bacterium]|nr:type I-E CRISPR-associated protein Cse1/CasA [Lachnospiraceae bacterium]